MLNLLGPTGGFEGGLRRTFEYERSSVSVLSIKGAQAVSQAPRELDGLPSALYRAEARVADENTEINTQSQPVSHQESPSVRIHISVQDTKACKLKEKIKKVTKRWETVEVDGFTFRRKRALPAAEQVAVSLLSKRLLSSPVAAATRPVAQALAEPCSPALLPSPLQDQEAARQAALATVNGLVASLTAGLEAEEDGAQQAFGTPKPKTPLQPQQVEQAPRPIALPIQQLSDREVQELQAAVQQHMPQDGTAAERLIDLCSFLLQEELREMGDSAPEPVRQVLQGVLHHLPAAVQAATDDGTLEVRTHASAAAPGAPDLAPVDWDGHRAALQQQLRHLQQEEACWGKVMEEASAMLAPAGDAELALQQGDSSEGPASPVLGPDSQQGALARAQERAERKVCLQVKGLAALVTGVEDLVAQAEQTCSLLQAEYHRDKFRNFPHVESPARLIREILRPPMRQSNLLPLLQ
ncbi:hypothetical protein WJX73_008818 [Symbiochloris irregularis]|uniref:Uncharacterized protein n=1 Tax=Symbiochloris irregularis TaxID=706552 RepID=A0AAW1P7Q6_9CHLO